MSYGLYIVNNNLEFNGEVVAVIKQGLTPTFLENFEQALEDYNSIDDTKTELDEASEKLDKIKKLHEEIDCLLD